MTAKKLNIAQAILKVDDVTIIEELAVYLRSKNIEIPDVLIKDKSIVELEKELSSSINDIENGKLISAKELLTNIKSW